MENSLVPVFVMVGVFLLISWKINLEVGPCTCGIFNASYPIRYPLMVESSGADIRCNGDGESYCKDVCAFLAIRAEKEVPDIICKSVMKHLDNVMPAVFSKVCRRGYKYTGLRSPTKICCNGEGKSIPCAD